MYSYPFHTSFKVLFQVSNDSAIGEEEKVERMGLTPDWIIHAGAFKVFQLKVKFTQILIL